MKVFKFGGASIRHAGAIRKVAGILELYKKDKLLVVVSAMGKTTNALEQWLASFRKGKGGKEEFNAIRIYHEGILKELFRVDDPIWQQTSEGLDALQKGMKNDCPADQLYDRIVSGGEIISSMILGAHLKEAGFAVTEIDARDYIVTDEMFREGKVDWKATGEKVQGLQKILETHIILTQGFIARSRTGTTTTLGREGSDFSAAIFAACLGAESVTIWKDVPGVMNADPKKIKEAVVFDELPFSEAAEMTYYGASVIHPKTIKPLANKNIPLLVKNFDDPSLPGTVIHETNVESLPPLFVFKENQCLVSCRVTDYTFIDEQQLSFIFSCLSELNIKINVMQNSAISFSFCTDFQEDKMMQLIERLSGQFEVYYNTDLTLVTIKNYDAAAYDQYTKKPGAMMIQSSRSTLQIILKN